jgi:hypothetical protein
LFAELFEEGGADLVAALTQPGKRRRGEERGSCQSSQSAGAHTTQKHSPHTMKEEDNSESVCVCVVVVF